MQARKLPLGTNCILVNAFDRSEKDSATINYYQIGPASLRSKLLSELLAEIFGKSIARSPKLKCCLISLEPIEDCGILGWNILARTVEADNTAEAVDEGIKKLRMDLVWEIENMPIEEFQKVVSSVVKEKTPNDSVLVHEVERNWSEILNGEYLFDRFNLERVMLSTVTQSELLQFYREHSGEHKRKLAIQFIGYTSMAGREPRTDTSTEAKIHKIPDDVIYAEPRTLQSGTMIKNIGEFIESLDVYQL